MVRLIYFGLLGSVLFTVGVGGCQSQGLPDPVTRIARASLQNVSDPKLTPPQTEEALKITAIVPQQWAKIPPNKSPLYLHQQWRSPTKFTGMGVVYARTPLPVSSSVLVWFARNEYLKREKDGKLLKQWTDAFGRHWFEGENAKYHVRGFAFTRGLDAWIIYCGYRLTAPASDEEIVAGNRSVQSILPGLN